MEKLIDIIKEYNSFDERELLSMEAIITKQLETNSFPSCYTDGPPNRKIDDFLLSLVNYKLYLMRKSKDIENLQDIYDNKEEINSYILFLQTISFVSLDKIVSSTKVIGCPDTKLTGYSLLKHMTFVRDNLMQSSVWRLIAGPKLEEYISEVNNNIDKLNNYYGR